MMFLLIVTLASMLVAAIMSLVAWRVAGEERRRSDARVEALAAEIHDVPPAPRRMDNDFELRASAGAPLRADFFTTPQPEPAGSRGRLAAAVAAGMLVVGSVAVLAVVSSSGSRKVANPARVGVAADAATAVPPPLELVDLGHDVDGDRLTVRGVVRNPVSAAPRDGLTAVVFLFNHEGGFLSSGRAAIESRVLAPGGQSIFVVTLPGAAEVGRYRVSFRTDDRIVPHVDRRSQS